MFKSTKEFDSTIKDILIKVRDGETLNLDDENSVLAIAECVSRGYLLGIECNRNGNGFPIIDCINPRIAYSGLQFIESYL